MIFILEFFNEFWITLCRMCPSLLFGFVMGGVLSVLFSASFVQKHLGRKGIMSIIKASLFGVPLPLCSCGVVPVAASLRDHGASKGSTVAFLTSTPQTGVDSIFVTYSLLGPIFAIFRPFAAFVSGVFSGVIIDSVVADDDDISQNSSAHIHTSRPKPNKFIEIFRFIKFLHISIN